MKISFFAKPPFEAKGHMMRVSSIIRGEQIAAYMQNARLNPPSGYAPFSARKILSCLISSMVRSWTWANTGDREWQASATAKIEMIFFIKTTPYLNSDD